MMNDVTTRAIALIGGILLGAFFFGGLWWTVTKGLTSHNPALWFFASTLLRTGLALTGFYFLSNGDWRKLLLSLVGFFIARIMVTRFTRATREGPHAS
jgi:F1F0 ATPase subunit 2